MEDELPSQFDLIVIGTGFSESIIAAAASRIGKTVLHLDPNEFYGGTWASFNLESFQDFIARVNQKDQNKTFQNACGITSGEQEWFIEENSEESENDNWTKERIVKEFRKFNIDLTPKLLFSSGKLVELLISSNISRYAEFRAIDNVCTIFEGQIRSVPCSRTDVFNSKDLTIIEKRLLMKLLSQCMTYEEHPEEFSKYEGMTFLEFLHENRLTDKIIHCVLHSISMCSDNTGFKEGMERIRKFLHGLGRYGNTPFLFPMYGCGEIPQCFCRLCAVFGGIYCLKKQIDKIKIEEKYADEKIEYEIHLESDNHIIRSKNLVIGNGDIGTCLPQNFQNTLEDRKKCGNLARAIFITSSPFGNETINSGGGGVNFLRIPDNINSVSIIQLSHYSGTCPKGLYLTHITSPSATGNAKKDLKQYIEQIFDLENPPKLLYSAYFIISECRACYHNMKNNLIHFACGPYAELDYDLSIENAKNIFDQIYPNSEFLPRAPDPEEIVMGDEDPTAPSSVFIASEKIITEDIKDKIKELEEGIENELRIMEKSLSNDPNEK
ncbi:rab proteins geranylgeranyltransferase component A [Condylostylus longicornis]|uniref:rab proteins geranylgeranyltransferase component A n=1 Tax=Condylostylus longicornis TaxID=2530218 RepID=UPI00244E5A0B|nr:rab proteins geranylgeranyltransferase component A [Condylostylus longicornis]